MKVLIAAAAGAALLAGCGTATVRATGAPLVDTPAATSTPDASAPASSLPASSNPASTGGPSGQCDPAGLRTALTSDRATYTTGGTAQLTLTVTWTGTAACTVGVGASVGGFLVKDAAGATVWSAGCSGSAAGKSGPIACPQLIRLESFAPGETHTYAHGWALQADATTSTGVAAVPAGSYTVSSSFDGVTATIPVTVS